MEIFMASAIGIAFCYMYVNSNDEEKPNHKRRNTSPKTESTQMPSKQDKPATVTAKEIATKSSKPDNRNVIVPATKAKPIVKKPDYSMQLINNMLDTMLADEKH